MSKLRNQRLSSTRMRKQQHLLEVTVRADKARTMRQRAIAAFILKTILLVGLCAGGWIGGKEGMRRYVWENPDFALTDIRVTTDGALLREQILSAGGVREGVNIFKVKTKAIRSEIDKLPQVEHAEIEIIRPNRLDITIIERRPIAWVTSRADENPTASDQAWLIDARGVVMKTKRMLEEYYHLPHISGVVAEDFWPGQRVVTSEMQAALEIVRVNADNVRWQARNLDLHKGYCVIVTDQNHAKITFGLDDVSGQLDRLFRYLERADAEKKEIQTVNLIVKKNTPVTFQQPAPEDGDPTPPQAPAATPMPVERAKPVLPPKTVPTPSKLKNDTKPTPRGKSSPTPSVRKPFRT
jgi:cell division septal protein FtsQ